jgi:hypothetical protein
MNRNDREQLNRIEVLLQRLDSAVVVRDPGSARAAEAFDGLRKSVIQASKSHRIHVAHLIALDESIRSGGTIELVHLRVGEYLRELGIERLADAGHPEAFDIVGDGEGDIEVLEAAIIERTDDGRVSVLKVGKAKRTVRPVSTPVLTDVSATAGLSVDTTTSVGDVSPASFPSKRGKPRATVVILGLAVSALLIVGIRSCRNEDRMPEPSDVTTITTLSVERDS